MLQKTIYLYSLLLIALCVVGCDTPYTGALGPQAFNGWIESEENGLVCLWNGLIEFASGRFPDVMVETVLTV